jgi:chromosome segregation ATPase
MTAISEAERSRRQSELEQRRAAEAEPASECACLRAELDALRAELTERRHAELTAIREALAESIDEVIDQVVTLNKRLQTELWNLVKDWLGDLRARVDGVLPDTKSAFRVARERADEVGELPDPLPPRRTIN